MAATLGSNPPRDLRTALQGVGLDVEAAVQPGEELIVGYALETTRIHHDKSGTYFAAEGRMFDLADQPVGHYQGVLAPPDPLPLAEFSKPPPMPSATAKPGSSSPVPTAGANNVTFYLGDDDSIVSVGTGTATVVSLSDGSSQFMVAAMGRLAGGTGRYAGARGVESACGTARIPKGTAFEPGTALHFKTFYVLRVIAKPSGRSKHFPPTRPTPAAPPAPPSPAARSSVARPPADGGLTSGLPRNADLLTYELGTVDRVLARIANFTLHSAPGAEAVHEPIRVDGRQIGLELHQPLHRLDIDLAPPSPALGVRAANRVAARAMAELTAELRLIPDDFVAAPGLRPPPTALDPRRSQRFVLLGCSLRFAGARARRLELFGTGRTFPAGGGRCRLGAALDLVDGQGPFAKQPGIVAVNGALEPPGRFSAALLLRVADPGGGLAAAPLPIGTTLPYPDPHTTLLLVKGENNFNHSTSLIVGLDGSLMGADLRQILRRVRISASSRPDGIGSATEIGAVAADLNGTIWFDLLSPPPVPFTTERGIFNFVDGDRRTVGWLEANIVDGRGFLTPLPGAPTPILRGVGLAPILRGTGAFDGAAGLLTVATWISIFPRQVSSLFLFSVDDPGGRFRVRGGTGS